MGITWNLLYSSPLHSGLANEVSYLDRNKMKIKGLVLIRRQSAAYFLGTDLLILILSILALAPNFYARKSLAAKIGQSIILHN